MKPLPFSSSEFLHRFDAELFPKDFGKWGVRRQRKQQGMQSLYFELFKQIQHAEGLHDEEQPYNQIDYAAGVEEMARRFVAWLDEKTGKVSVVQKVAEIMKKTMDGLPDLPCRVDEMTPKEFAIYERVATLLGAMQFLHRELAENQGRHLADKTPDPGL